MAGLLLLLTLQYKYLLELFGDEELNFDISNTVCLHLWSNVFI